MAYQAGAASVPVTPDFSGFHKKIGAELTKEDATFVKAGDRWGKLSADAFSARWKAADMPSAKIKTDLDDLKAKAELAGLTRDRRAKVKVDVDKSSLSRFQKVLGGVFSHAPSVPNAPLLGSIPGGLAGLAAAVPAVEALLSETVALASGFAAAGAGAGAFAALAIPTFKSVSSAYQQINTDQKAYDRALTKTSRNTALKHLKQDWASLDPAQRTAIKGIQGLVTQYHKLSTAFQPQVMKVFNDGLSIASHLLPRIAPFANSFANALDGLLKRFDRFTQSKGFSQWLSQFQKLVGPSVTAIGNGIGKLAPAIGKLLTVFSAKDVVTGINIAFDVLTGIINGTAYAVNRLRTNWDSMWGAAKTAFFAAAPVIIKGVQSLTDDVLSALKFIVHGAADAFGWVPGLGGKLKAADKALGSFRKSVDQSFGGAIDKVNSWKATYQTAPKIARLTGNISDLTRKLATAKSKLRDPDLTKTRRAQLQANIADLERKIARAQALLRGLHNKTVYATVVEQVVTAQVGKTAASRLPHLLGYASGTNSATRGWHLVGENGPEVEWFNGGEKVRPLGAGLNVPSLSMPSVPQVRGGDGSLTLRLAAAGNDRLLRAIVDALRVDVQSSSGGDVQRHLGRGKART